jgi:glycosyltransferase involved in cell wall biosynthesis
MRAKVIRFIVPDAWRAGGRVRAVFNLSGALAARHRVEIASAQRSRHDPAMTPPPGVELIPVLTPEALADYISQARKGVIIATEPTLSLTLAQARRRSVVAIAQEHGTLARLDDDTRRQIARWYPRLDAQVSLTGRDARAYRQLLGNALRTLCIPNPIHDVGDLRASLTAPRAIAAGRLVRNKGFDMLMRAWRQVNEVHPDWKLVVFGEGPARPRLEEVRQRLGLADAVSFPGFTDRLDEELAASSFFVLSSRHEGLPMVILEAMAVGLPVVSFDCPTGPRELVRPDTGILVPPGRVRRLGAAMTSMIDRGDERLALGAAARQRAQEYQLPEIARRWEELFRQLA